MDEGPVAGSTRRPRILLTSYMSNATCGQNLGAAGYSYDFVAGLFQPLLERRAEVLAVRRPETELDREAEKARREQREPIHVSFRPFHHAVLCRTAPNVLVPAWEFPDVPDHAFDGDPRNNWAWMANLCDLVVVGGPFTAEAFRRAGVTAPIEIVPVPVSQAYFHTPPWEPAGAVRMECLGHVFRRDQVSVTAAPETRDPASAYRPAPPKPNVRHLLLAAFRHYKRLLRPRLPALCDVVLSASAQAARTVLHSSFSRLDPAQELRLSGVVYTSIFNPGDGRKNWEDSITGFLAALRDREDATLVLKLITSDPISRRQVFDFYRRLNVEHCCKLVVITDFLSEAQMWELARATTYYVNTARAEGNCLPLMNYLAAGRPGVAPAHTAMADYFSADVGFPVASHAEPAAWPQDSRLRWRTTWQRLVWPSLVEQFRESYRVAKEQPARYQALAERGRARMAAWSGEGPVARRLWSALDRVSGRLALGDGKSAQRRAA